MSTTQSIKCVVAAAYQTFKQTNNYSRIEVKHRISSIVLSFGTSCIFSVNTHTVFHIVNSEIIELRELALKEETD